METSRVRFELTKDKIVFALELALTGVALGATAIVAALGPNLVPVIFFGGGGVGGLAVLIRRRTRLLRQT